MKLKESNSQFSRLLGNSFKGKENEIKTVLNLCRASLKSLISKVSSRDKPELKRLIKKIEIAVRSEFTETERKSPLAQLLGSNNYNEDQLWKLYRDILFQINALKELIEDKKIVE